MYYRCELLINGYSYDVTNDLMNWDDVELNYKRDDLNGVIRTFSTKFEFSNGAYSLLVEEYESRYLQSSASVVFYKRNNSWLWNEVFRCSLDFSTFSYSGHSCEINAVDDSLAALIKSKKGTQYEYVVDEIKESEPLLYDHLEMLSSVTWIDRGALNDEGTESLLYYSSLGEGEHHPLPIIVQNSEIAVKEVVEFNDIYASNNKSTSTLPMFISAIRGTDIHLSIYFGFRFYSSPEDITITLYKRTLSGEEELKGINYNALVSLTNEFSYDGDLHLEAGEGLILSIYKFGSEYGGDFIYLSDFEIKAVYQNRDLKAINIDIIKPSVLLNRLLKSMNGGVDGITGEIATTDERLNNTMLMAADSARGLDGAKLYSSYTKFVDWMNAEFGFVPVIGDKRVSFVHRDTLFRDEEIKDLGSDLSGFEFSVNAGMIYSRVRVGYDKVDYESVNGLDEFRFTNEYTTGTTLSDNSLELISPYRADAYGIEFLVNKRGEDTTDDDSDNDVFMVGVRLNENRYELIRDIPIEGVISPDTMYNVMYSQRYMIGANSKYIGVFSNLLSYASSDGNSDVVIDGEPGNGDIAITGSLFSVGQMSVETSDNTIPSDFSGYVLVENRGKTYKGFIRDVGFNVGRTEKVKYTLIVKEIQKQ